MIIRTFEAETLRGAMRRVQEELGDEAIILRTRQIKSQRPEAASRWEVAARALSVKDYASVSDVDNSEDTLPEQPVAPDQELTIASRERDSKAVGASHAVHDLRKDLEALRQDAGNWSGLELRLDKALETLHAEVVQLGRHLQTAAGDGRHRDPLMRGLITAGVEPLIATAIVQRARARVAPERGLAVAKAPDLLAELVSALPTTPPLWSAPTPGRHGGAATDLHALVGPTGTGKTRTLVKLATSAAFGHDRRVAIVTLDLQRIGGLETLRAFSGILGITMRKAANRRELISTLRELGRCDLVFIDTPGCSQWDDATLARTADTLNIAGVKRHLVIPASMRAEDAALISQRFGTATLSSLIVTKLDEARGPGALLSGTWGSGISISHICNGQDVPESCKAAEADQLVNQIMMNAA